MLSNLNSGEESSSAEFIFDETNDTLSLHSNDKEYYEGGVNEKITHKSFS